MSSAITNDGSDIIKKTIDTKYSVKSDEETINRYEIFETAEWIRENKFTTVGLQFSNEVEIIAVPIALKLKSLVDCEFGIMPDLHFGNCCVDDIAAQRDKAQAIVHYGNSCLTPTHRVLQTRIVFGRTNFDDDFITGCANDIKTHVSMNKANVVARTCVTLLSDHHYIEFSGNIAEILSRDIDICVHRTMPNMFQYKDGLSESQYEVIGSRIFPRKHTSNTTNECGEQNGVIVYVCYVFDRSVKTTLLALFHLNQPMIIYNPITHTITDVTVDIARFLKSRLHKIELCKSAKRVGLLVGNLSMEGYLDIYDYLWTIMERAGKDVMSSVMSKINPCKLNNYPNCDVFVVINCVNSCLQFSDKSDDFYKPVVTPYEMVCALGYDSDRYCNPLIRPYITDFRQLLIEENLIDGLITTQDVPSMSLISGRLIHNEAHHDEHKKVDGTLISRLESQWSLSTIDQSSRSWFGLEPNLGLDPVSMVTQGRSGIASVYSDEVNNR